MGGLKAKKRTKSNTGGKNKGQKADFVQVHRYDYRKTGTFSVASARRVIALTEKSD